MLGARERQVLRALLGGARTIEELIAAVGLVEGGWYALLSGLRIRGYIVREPLSPSSWRFQYALTASGMKAID